MLKDLLHSILQEDLRDTLLGYNFDEVICYIGAGADISPCVFMEKADLNRIGIKKGNPIFFFCDPRFTNDGHASQGLYNELVEYFIEKGSLDASEIDILMDIEKNENSVNFNLGEGKKDKWKQIQRLKSFRRINLKNGPVCWYEELIIQNKPSVILYFSIGFEELWESILSKYDIPVSGAFIIQKHYY